jgi:molybdenum cofactor synthesis domain-containing protein
MSRVTASAVIIGNEVLSAKVEEQNGAWLIQRLHLQGVELRSLCMVRDEVDAIVGAVARAHREADWVVTSGGIGPTHDDVTVRAVALALSRNVVRRPEIEAGIRSHYRARGGSPPPEAFRLAEVPEGTALLENPGSGYPIFLCDRIFILPGVPELFRRQLEVVLPRLGGSPLHYRELLLNVGESELAQALDEVALSMPDVAIGSYPQFDPAISYRVKVTVEHERPARVEEAVAALLAKAQIDRGAD